MKDTLAKIDKCSAEYIQFQSHLDTNLDTIKTNLPELYTRLVESPEEYIDLYMHKTLDQKYGISFKKPENPDELFIWISCDAVTKEHTLQQIKKHEQWGKIYLFCGVGDGFSINFLFMRSKQGGFTPNMRMPIFVVEEEVFLFRIFLMLNDVSELIASQRVFFFVGDNAVMQFSHYIKHSSFAKLPDTYIVNHLYQKVSTAPAISKLCVDRAEYVMTRIQALLESLAMYYNRCSVADWQALFCHHRKRRLRVLGITSIHTSFLQYCMRDWLQGFKDSGCEIKLLCEFNETSEITPLFGLETIDAFKPDIIIIIDHLRDECQWLPKNIPYVCWIQDELPNLIEDRGYRLSIFDFTYVLASHWIGKLKKISTYATADIKTLTLGCNTSVYYPIEQVNKSIDVLYVTHMHDPAKTFYPLRYTDISIKLLEKEAYLMKKSGIEIDQLAIIFDRLRCRVDKLSITDMTVLYKNRHEMMQVFIHDALIGSYVEQFSNDINLINYFSESNARLYYDLVLRIKFLPIQYLIHHDISVALFGNNWEKLPECKRYAKGIVENGEALNQVMNQAKICINNSGDISFHMRAIEIMASQNFMLSRDIPDDGAPLLDHFIANNEVVFFEDQKSLLEKVIYYLNHEIEREQVAKNAYQKIVEKFSYKEIAERVVHDLGMKYKGLTKK